MLQMIREKSNTMVKGAAAMWACMMLAAAVPAFVQAQTAVQGITVQGTDQSASMGSLTDMGATTVSFLLGTVAKVVGVGIAIWAITDLVKREIVWGAVKLALSGMCFFLPKIISSIAAVGNGGTAPVL